MGRGPLPGPNPGRPRVINMAEIKVIPKDEVLSLEDGETRVLLIVDFRYEEVKFPEYSDPAWTRTIPARQFVALQIDITEENGEPLKRRYWIDSLRLMYILRALLAQWDAVPRRYHIIKHGFPPDSHYEVAAR